MSGLARRGLFLRIFLYGIVLLVASSSAGLLLDAYVLRPSHDAGVSGFESWVSRQLCSNGPEGLEHDPPSVGRRPFRVTLFNEKNEMIGTTMQPPYAPLSDAEMREAKTRGGIQLESRHARAVICQPAARAAYVVLQGPPLRFPMREVAWVLGVAFVVVVIASYPLARSLAAPIERLVATTRAFGSGDLAARADVVRRDEIGDLSSAFNEMAERLEHHVRAEKEILANVSHELRTPLARIRVVLETAQESPARAQALLEEISLDLYDLERLVNDVLDTIRLETAGASQLPARLEPTDIGAVVEDAARRFRTVRADRDVRVDVAPALPEAMADARLLRRLLDNLLSNADKYSDARGLIAVRARGAGDMLAVEVEDHGIGIDAEDLPHVFTAFFRADRSRTRATGGVGLGLALAKRIADMHGAKIAVRSAPGEGTTVTFEIPVIAASEVASPASPGSPDKRAS